MVRRIIAGLVLVLLVYLGVVWYRGRSDKAKLDSGEFTCQGCLEGEAKARFLKENAGETVDGNSERKSAFASVAAGQATTSSGAAAIPPGSVSPVIVPPSTTNTTGTSSMIVPQSNDSQPPADPAAASAPVPTNVSDRYSSRIGAPPASDSVSPNPQNDVHFRGAGSFEWYRQGNITWRVDTTTGHSCIVYATMEEWRKEIVISHGCGRTV